MTLVLLLFFLNIYVCMNFQRVWLVLEFNSACKALLEKFEDFILSGFHVYNYFCSVLSLSISVYIYYSERN